ncbi:MAG: hypothetical protein WCI04_03280 [archaeon]
MIDFRDKKVIIAVAVGVVVIVALLGVFLFNSGVVSGGSGGFLVVDSDGKKVNAVVTVSKDGKVLKTYSSRGSTLSFDSTTGVLSGSMGTGVDSLVVDGSYVDCNGKKRKLSGSGAVVSVDSSGGVSFSFDTGESVFDWCKKVTPSGDASLDGKVSVILRDSSSGEVWAVDVPFIGKVMLFGGGCVGADKKTVKGILSAGEFDSQMKIKMDCFDKGDLNAFVEWSGEKKGTVDVALNNYSGYGALDSKSRTVWKNAPRGIYDTSVVFTPYEEFAGQTAEFNVNFSSGNTKSSVRFFVPIENFEQCIKITPNEVTIPANANTATFTIDASTCASQNIELTLCKDDTYCSGGTEGGIQLDAQSFTLYPASAATRIIEVRREDIPGAYGIPINVQTDSASGFYLGEVGVTVQPQADAKIVPDKFEISLLPQAKDSMRITNKKLSQDVNINASVCLLHKNSLGFESNTETTENNPTAKNWWQNLSTDLTSYAGEGKYEKALTAEMQNISAVQEQARKVSKQKNDLIKKAYDSLNTSDAKGKMCDAINKSNKAFTDATKLLEVSNTYVGMYFIFYGMMVNGLVKTDQGLTEPAAVLYFVTTEYDNVTGVNASEGIEAADSPLEATIKGDILGIDDVLNGGASQCSSANIKSNLEKAKANYESAQALLSTYSSKISTLNDTTLEMIDGPVDDLVQKYITLERDVNEIYTHTKLANEYLLKANTNLDAAMIRLDLAMQQAAVDGLSTASIDNANAAENLRIAQDDLTLARYYVDQAAKEQEKTIAPFDEALATIPSMYALGEKVKELSAKGFTENKDAVSTLYADTGFGGSVPDSTEPDNGTICWNIEKANNSVWDAASSVLDNVNVSNSGDGTQTCSGDKNCCELAKVVKDLSNQAEEDYALTCGGGDKYNFSNYYRIWKSSYCILCRGWGPSYYSATNKSKELWPATLDKLKAEFTRVQGVLTKFNDAISSMASPNIFDTALDILPQAITASKWLSDQEKYSSLAASYPKEFPGTDAASYNSWLTGIIGSAISTGFVNGAYDAGVYTRTEYKTNYSYVGQNSDPAGTGLAVTSPVLGNQPLSNYLRNLNASMDGNFDVNALTVTDNLFEDILYQFDKNSNSYGNFTCTHPPLGGWKENCANMVNLKLPGFVMNLLAPTTNVKVSNPRVLAEVSSIDAKVFGLFEQQEVGLVFTNNGLEENEYGVITLKVNESTYGNPLIVTKDFAPFKIPSDNNTMVSFKYHVRFNATPRKTVLFSKNSSDDCSSSLLRGSTGASALPKTFLSWDWGNVSNLTNLGLDGNTGLVLSGSSIVSDSSNSVAQLAGSLTQSNWRVLNQNSSDVSGFVGGVDANGYFLDSAQVGVLFGGRLADLKNFVDSHSFVCPVNPIVGILDKVRPNITSANVGLSNVVLGSSGCYLPYSTLYLDGKPSLYYFVAPDRVTDVNVALYAEAQKLVDIIDFNVNLIRDGYGISFSKDFANYYFTVAFKSEGAQNDLLGGIKPYFEDQARTYFSSEAQNFNSNNVFVVPDAGTYRGLLRIDFGTNPVMFANGKPSAKVVFDLYSRNPVGAETNPLYYLPFDGPLAEKSLTQSEGYGTKLAQEKILQVNSTEGATLKSTAAKALLTASYPGENSIGPINANPSLRGKVLEITLPTDNKDYSLNPQIKFTPMLATPITAWITPDSNKTTIAYSIESSGNKITTNGGNFTQFELNNWCDTKTINKIDAKQIIDNPKETNTWEINLNQKNQKNGWYLTNIIYTPTKNAFILIDESKTKWYSPDNPSNVTFVPLRGTKGTPYNYDLQPQIQSLNNTNNAVTTKTLCTTTTSGKTKYWIPKNKTTKQNNTNIKTQCN